MDMDWTQEATQVRLYEKEKGHLSGPDMKESTTSTDYVTAQNREATRPRFEELPLNKGRTHIKKQETLD